jgi:hypothetical protein
MFNVSILSVLFQYKVTKYNAPDCPMVGAECFPAILCYLGWIFVKSMKNIN